MNGVIYLQNKVVLITGAGFSAPAKLPIQDKILEEMIETPTIDFMSAEPTKESVKFLIAYINVTLYLLQEYGNCNTDILEKEFNEIVFAYHSDDRVAEILNYIQKTYEEAALNSNFNIYKVLDDVADNYIVEKDMYCMQLVSLKEKLRKMLEHKRIVISLEDVFTSFDKCITARENTKNYTYAQMDRLQHSVLRLFIYYFSKKTNEHNYLADDYAEVIRFLRTNSMKTSIITTNWDVLLEKYMDKNEIKYDYGFNSKYVIDSNIKFEENTDEEKIIRFLKVHGSINWFRCLRCGTLQVCNSDECGLYLFDDIKKEKCNQCGQVAYGSKVQLKPEIITPTMMKSINNQLLIICGKMPHMNYKTQIPLFFAGIHCL